MAMAKTAGSTPRSTRRPHQVNARTGSALGRTAKNFHSLRSRRRWIMEAFRRGQAYRCRCLRSSDFLHRSDARSRKGSSFGFEVADDVFDDLVELRIELHRIISMNPCDQVGALP